MNRQFCAKKRNDANCMRFVLAYNAVKQDFDGNEKSPGVAAEAFFVFQINVGYFRLPN